MGLLLGGYQGVQVDMGRIFCIGTLRVQDGGAGVYGCGRGSSEVHVLELVTHLLEISVWVVVGVRVER